MADIWPLFWKVSSPERANLISLLYLQQRNARFYRQHAAAIAAHFSPSERRNRKKVSCEKAYLWTLRRDRIRAAIHALSVTATLEGTLYHAVQDEDRAHMHALRIAGQLHSSNNSGDEEALAVVGEPAVSLYVRELYAMHPSWPQLTPMQEQRLHAWAAEYLSITAEELRWVATRQEFDGRTCTAYCSLVHAQSQLEPYTDLPATLYHVLKRTNNNNSTLLLMQKRPPELSDQEVRRLRQYLHPLLHAPWLTVLWWLTHTEHHNNNKHRTVEYEFSRCQLVKVRHRPARPGGAPAWYTVYAAQLVLPLDISQQPLIMLHVPQPQPIPFEFYNTRLNTKRVFRSFKSVVRCIEAALLPLKS